MGSQITEDPGDTRDAGNALSLTDLDLQEVAEPHREDGLTPFDAEDLPGAQTDQPGAPSPRTERIIGSTDPLDPDWTGIMIVDSDSDTSDNARPPIRIPSPPYSPESDGRGPLNLPIPFIGDGPNHDGTESSLESSLLSV